MKYFYFIATLLFWLTVIGFWVTRSWLPVTDVAAYDDQLTVYSLSDVAEHDQQTDCWMAIHGQVYDLTAYLPQHPTTLRVILPSCGMEASHAYDTKNRDRPHSDEADSFLTKYRIGVLDH